MVFEEKEKLENPGKNLLGQSKEPAYKNFIFVFLSGILGTNSKECV